MRKVITTVDRPFLQTLVRMGELSFFRVRAGEDRSTQRKGTTSAATYAAAAAKTLSEAIFAIDADCV